MDTYRMDIYRYEVTTADPGGYWLIPHGSSNPDEWAFMELPNPVEELARLTAELVEAREDTARLDWLCSHALAVTYTGGRNGCAVTWLCDRDGDLRAAIDEAKDGE